jgi:hypothetical protein
MKRKGKKRKIKKWRLFKIMIIMRIKKMPAPVPKVKQATKYSKITTMEIVLRPPLQIIYLTNMKGEEKH